MLTLVVLLVNAALLVNGGVAAEPTRPIRIGALTASWGPTPSIVGLRDGLRELGYRQPEQIDIGVRFTQGDMTALPAAARELATYGVDLIFADFDDAARAAQMATAQIPIIFANVADPVGMGLVKSFARPGTNLTGVTDLELELGPKRLDLFRHMIPRLQRVLFAYDATHALSVAAAAVYREATRRLGIELVERAVRSEAEARMIFDRIEKAEVDGIMGPPHLSMNIPGVILEVAVQRGMPSMFATAFLVEHGGLASYGSDLYASGRMAARLVDKILKGASVSEIPVEVNTKLEFVINLKTAKALGVTIAPEVLYQADRLIR